MKRVFIGERELTLKDLNTSDHLIGVEFISGIRSFITKVNVRQSHDFVDYYSFARPCTFEIDSFAATRPSIEELIRNFNTGRKGQTLEVFVFGSSKELLEWMLAGKVRNY